MNNVESHDEYSEIFLTSLAVGKYPLRLLRFVSLGILRNYLELQSKELFSSLLFSSDCYVTVKVFIIRQRQSSALSYHKNIFLSFIKLLLFAVIHQNSKATSGEGRINVQAMPNAVAMLADNKVLLIEKISTWIKFYANDVELNGA